MKLLKSIAIGILIYVSFFLIEKAIHYTIFHLTHNFGTDNTRLIISSLFLNLAPIVGGFTAGYLSQKGFVAGAWVGVIASMLSLVFHQATGANPLNQEFTPSIIFDDVFIPSCIASMAGAAGELIRSKRPI